MNLRLVAIVTAGCLLASCGGPATPSVTGAQISTLATSAPTTSARETAPPSPDPSPRAAACRLSDPVSIPAPASLLSLGGSVAGLTDQGELIVVQSHLVGVVDTLSLLDPRSGAITPVVSRPVAKSQDAAKSSIGGAPIGNADWVVWEEVGPYLEHADWTMWALDRRSGTIRKVASFAPGPDGLAAPGWASDVSLLGDVATWSAPAMLGPNRAGERIYVADLRAKTVQRLDVEAKWPALASANQLVAAMQVGTDPGSGKVLAQPTTITIASGATTVQDWIGPARLLAQASSSAGTVVTRLVKEATAEDPVTVAEVLTHDAAGVTRTFPLPNDWGPVVAGTGFLAWTDQRDLWILPSGQAEPTLLLTTPDDSTQIAILVNGSTVFWRTVGDASSWTANAMATVVCS